ncbi:hypothetical protein PCASD_13333 [Puccinia coronata f. sp. avenae]|uniref:Kinesin motor domain-containing protein n=1 Tax=Puccinia coronata f. sp. avenae TaxID=200324 RepID=A0A2N5SUJ2_9BASI|nr:hypothetical protein PCASD_13333 [Puccinia coronata f. sp. avenae]
MKDHQQQEPASNFSSPSSETSQSNTLPKIHSFSSITQLYFKFSKQTSNASPPPASAAQAAAAKQPPAKQPPPSAGERHQRLSTSAYSISSSYSNQSNQYYLNNRPSIPPATHPSPDNRLHIPTPLLPSAVPAPKQQPPQRTLQHQSSLPRFTQPKFKLRPRLSSASHTTPLAITKKISPPSHTSNSLYYNHHHTQDLLLNDLITTSSSSSNSNSNSHNNSHSNSNNSTAALYQPSKTNSFALALNYNPSSNHSYFLPGRCSSPSATSSASQTSSASSLLQHNSIPSSSPSKTSTSATTPTLITTPLAPVSSTLHLQSKPSTQPIHVIVRLRDQTKPNPSQAELISFDNESITLRIPVSMTNINQQVNSYEFKVDKVIYPTPNAKLNEKVYERCSIDSKLLIPFLNGFNSSLIAYGQTGSGKSFTLGSDHDPNNTDGLIPKTLERLFAKTEQEKQELEVELLVSFIEIYNDEIIDLLLNPPAVPNPAAGTAAAQEMPAKNQKKVPIKIHEDKQDGSIDLVGCKKLKISNITQAMLYFNHGLAQRSIGVTQMNQNSSRSHAIFTVHLIASSTSSSSTSSSNHINDSHLITKKTCSKFQFVDLAGSERINKTKNILGGDRFKEGIFINAGLHSLGNVISALSNQPSSLDGKNSGSSKKKNHIPYRESKLTRLLKDCLGGNSKTILISCISQNAQDLNESLNTLRYAIRAKKIENVSLKTTKVISTPSAPPEAPMRRIPSSRGPLHASLGAPRSRIQTVGTPRMVQGGGGGTGALVRTRSRAGTLMADTGRREIKKPMVMMKHELSKIRALKAMVSKGASAAAAASGQAGEQDDAECPAVYLANQVHKFFLLNQNQFRLRGPLTRPLTLNAQLVNILQSHFSLEIPHSPGAGFRAPLMAPSSSSSSSSSSSALVPRNAPRLLNRSPPSLVTSLPSSSTGTVGADVPGELALDDPFLLFLVDLNAFFCNSVAASSPPPSASAYSYSALPRPAILQAPSAGRNSKPPQLTLF